MSRDAGRSDARERLHAEGLLGEVDVRVSSALGRLGGESRPDVLLAAALAVRAPRHGHVCVELDGVAARLVTDQGKAPEVDWPEPEAWLRSLASSPLVRSGPGAPDREARPLVLARRRLYLDRYWRYETRLAGVLAERASEPADAPDPARLAAVLDRLFGDADGGQQRLAAATAARRRLAVVAGGPGTGKTTTVARILATLLELARHDAASVPRVALSAPTGKAAARLREAVAETAAELPVAAPVAEAVAATPSATLHRLLGRHPQRSTRFRHDRRHPLPHDVVVVDEASMVPLSLMAKLGDALRPDARLVLLGDRDQLASVEAGAVFGDLCGPPEEEPTPRSTPGAAAEAARGPSAHDAPRPTPGAGFRRSVVRLVRTHRFAEGGGIAGVAACVRRGDAEATLAAIDDAEEVTRVPATEDAAILGAVVEAYAAPIRQLRDGDGPAAALGSLTGVRVLCALRGGPDGVAAWNARIEAALAAAVSGYRADSAWPVGRPVLVTENDYGLGLYNGDVGVVVPGADARRPQVAFPGEHGAVRIVPALRLPSVETVLATTVHKSQGSQFDHAVVVLPRRGSPLLTRELVYTAITRSRSRVTVIADAAVLADAVGRPIQRASGLRDALWGDGPAAGV